MKLNETQTKEILSIKDSHITKELFLRLFGKTEASPTPKYSPNDSFVLKKGDISIFNEKTPIVTTIGRYIFNIFLNESCFKKVLPYFNGFKFNDYDIQVTYALLEDLITVKDYGVYQTKQNWLGYTPTEILVPGLTFNMICPNPIVMKRKQELLAIHAKELASGNVIIATQIETELKDLAEKVLKSDPSFRLLELKKPSFPNNYKNMSIMIGPQNSNTNPGEFYVSQQNLSDGLNIEDYASHADSNIFGTYQRSVETQDGGSRMKEFSSAFQSETINLDTESDCHTPYYLNITLNETNIKLYLLRFVKGPKGLEMIKPSNMNSYINRPLKMRSVLYCNHDKFCSRCAGLYFAKLGIENVGSTSITLGSKIQGMAMKSFHDSTISTTDMMWEKYFNDY
jgi:ribosomal protein L31